MTTKPTPAIAECRWFWRDVANHQWVPEGEPQECRASIADKAVTVWLPSGSRIRKRRPDDAISVYDGRYSYGFDWNSLTSNPERLVRFTLKPA